MKMQRIAAVVVAAVTAAAFVPAAHADRDHHWHGDIHRFAGHDYDHWRGGHWYRGPHGGRSGWWWVVGGGWYFYPQPVYPYPDPYVPPMVAVPQPVVPAPPASFWYYCDAYRAYYPYVPSCPTGWRAVPAQR